MARRTLFKFKFFKDCDPGTNGQAVEVQESQIVHIYYRTSRSELRSFGQSQWPIVLANVACDGDSGVEGFR